MSDYKRYDLLSDTPLPYVWSGNTDIPKIGDTVDVVVNSIGKSVVESYFKEAGYLGVIVKPLSPPPWFVKQNGKNSICHIFGIETKQPAV